MTLPVSPPLSITQIATEFGGNLPHSISEYYGAAAGVPASGAISFTDFLGKSAVVPGQQAWTTAGTYSFVVPSGVTQIAAVAIGGGGGGRLTENTSAYYGNAGGGGALAYSNSIAVTPGETLTIIVGAKGTNGSGYGDSGGPGGDSAIQRAGSNLLMAKGGGGGSLSNPGSGGSAASSVGTVKYSGGSGGSETLDSFDSGGGGAGDYTANGRANALNPEGTSLTGNNTGTFGAGNSGRRGNPLDMPNDNQNGGVRVMWGDSRSFPSNAGDV